MDTSGSVTISKKVLMAGVAAVIAALVVGGIVVRATGGNDSTPDVSEAGNGATDSDVEDPGSAAQAYEDLLVFVCGTPEGGTRDDALARLMGALVAEQCNTPEGNLPAFVSVFESSTGLQTYLRGDEACDLGRAVAGEIWLVQTLDPAMATDLQTEGGGVLIC